MTFERRGPLFFFVSCTTNPHFLLPFGVRFPRRKRGHRCGRFVTPSRRYSCPDDRYQQIRSSKQSRQFVYPVVSHPKYKGELMLCCDFDDIAPRVRSRSSPTRHKRNAFLVNNHASPRSDPIHEPAKHASNEQHCAHSNNFVGVLELNSS